MVGACREARIAAGVTPSIPHPLPPLVPRWSTGGAQPLGAGRPVTLRLRDAGLPLYPLRSPREAGRGRSTGSRPLASLLAYRLRD